MWFLLFGKVFSVCFCSTSPLGLRKGWSLLKSTGFVRLKLFLAIKINTFPTCGRRTDTTKKFQSLCDFMSCFFIAGNVMDMDTKSGTGYPNSDSSLVCCKHLFFSFFLIEFTPSKAIKPLRHKDYWV